MTDDLITLASAYLDGAVTPAERAQVEADPELLTEVERLRRVRAVVGDAEGAPISVRERHLAAALDAWDRMPAAERSGDSTPSGALSAAAAGGASITAPTSLRDRRDRRSRRKPLSSRVLTIAAAAVVLVGAGVVINGAMNSGSDDSSADFGIEADDDAAATAELESTPLDAAAETFDSDDEAADEVVVAAPPVAPDADAISGGPEVAPASSDLEVLSGNDELAVFANAKVISRTGVLPDSDAATETGPADGPDNAPADVEDTAPDTTLAPPVDLCGLVDEFVGFALWDTAGLFDEPISVGIDNPTGEAVAYQDATCTEIARTPLP